MKIVFAGTPDFAATILEGLLDCRHTVTAVLTQPDRPAGRGRTARPSPVKQLALARDATVLQPGSLREPGAQRSLRELDAQAMVVAAYGLILPPPVLAMFPKTCINVHASLLPRWRGAAPIQRAILAGDACTGISIMRMDEGLDTGDVYLQTRCKIREGETSGSLHERLATLGRDTLLQALPGIEDGSLHTVAQDQDQATYAHMLSKQEARLDWTRCATHLERCVRAYHPWPVAFTHLGDPSPQSRIRIHAAQAVDAEAGTPPGTVSAVSGSSIDVSCGSGVLRLRVLQRPGKQAVDVARFLHGMPVRVGQPLQ